MTDDDVMKEFNATVAKVRTSKSEQEQAEAAKHVFELTKGERGGKFDDKTIMGLASLLDTTNDTVRYWVARSIGNFGERARMAAPKLEQVLAEVDCMEGSKTSASGIRFALSQMGIEVPEPDCDTDKP